MTKRHFIALADALRITRPGFPHEDENPARAERRKQWVRDRDAIADALGAQNDKFKRQLWIDYTDGKCGPGRWSIR
jgi:hypothetical protein